MIHATRKTLVEAANKVEESEKTEIEAAISELEEALKGDDKEAIETGTQKLTEASSSLAQRMYAEAQQEAAGQGEEATATADTGGDPDAVDAEFEEVKDDK